MIHGKKIFLSDLKETNLEQLRQWRNKPELRKYFREHRLISELMQNDWFEKAKKDQNQYNFEIYAIEPNGPPKLIGHCGLYYINWIHRFAEFGIYIGDPNYREGGFGSDALRTLIGYGFNDLNLNKIWCEVYGNNKSLDIYRHLGFHDDGILRQNYFNEGQYWDSYLLSMLKSEFETLHTKQP